MTRPASSQAPMEELFSLEGAEFVRTAYRHVLRRDADPGGFVAYFKRLQSGTSKRQIFDELSNSPEGLRVALMHSNGSAAGPSLDQLLGLHGEVFVQCAYLAMLGREADAEGLQYYATRLATGVSALQVLGEIAASPEYALRARPLAGLTQRLAFEASLRRRLLRRVRASLRGFRRPLTAQARRAPSAPAERRHVDHPLSSVATRESNPERAALAGSVCQAAHDPLPEDAPAASARSVIASRMQLQTLPGLARRSQEQ